MTGIWDPLAPELKILRFEALRDLLLAEGMSADVECVPGPQRPDVPNGWAMITPYGGAGQTMAGAFDQRAFQVQSAGNQRDPASSEQLANLIDRAFIQRRDGRLVLSELAVTEIFRLGGPPSVLERDGERDIYVCNYGIEVESYG